LALPIGSLIAFGSPHRVAPNGNLLVIKSQPNFYAGCRLTRLLCASMAHPIDIGEAIIGTMAKSEKNNNKLKINLTLRKEQRDKLQQMAALEKRSVSNLTEVMADERWERLVQQQGKPS
jgi:hypothetical protein